MEDQILNACQTSIDSLISDFQSHPDRFWNERDIHWRFYYRLKQEAVFQEKDSLELIRAEFPTRRARGHLDLAILDPVSVNSKEVRDMKPWAEWDEYLSKVKVLIGIEIKMWLSRWSRDDAHERMEWDIEKLTEIENTIKHQYFLNLVQLDFEKPNMRDYYDKLRSWIAKEVKGHPDLRVLYLPSDKKIQSDSIINWIQ